MNMFCGGASIIASISGKYKLGIALVIMAGIFDRYDGAVARKFNTSSDLGVQLDSMADALSFGLAPAILIYMKEFKSIEKALYPLAIITIIYIVCGLFRLARYNAYGLDNGYFTGIPITACGMFLVALGLLSNMLNYYLYAIILLVLAYSMVSKHKIKKI